MRIGNLKLTKPWGVVVNRGGKLVLKEFDTVEQAQELTSKLAEFDNLEYELIEKKKRGIDGRAESPAFVRVDARNLPEGYYFKCVPVRPLKGLLFCTECHDYKKFRKTTDEYGLTLNCCPDCGLADSDFHIKIANGKFEAVPSK